MKFISYIPIITPVIIFLFLEGILSNPLFFTYFLTACNLLILTAVFFILKGGLTSKNFFLLSIFPILFLNSIVIFTLLLRSRNFMHIAYIFTVLLLFIFFNLSFKNQKKLESESTSIENLSNYGNLIIFFCMASSVFGIQDFLNWPTWLLMIILVVLTLFSLIENFSSNRISFRYSFLFMLALCLVLIELAFCLSYLSLSFIISGMLMSIFYYMAVGLTRTFLKSGLSRSTVQIYTVIGTACIILLLLTSRWL
jgi:hypothetical protein